MKKLLLLAVALVVTINVHAAVFVGPTQNFSADYNNMEDLVFGPAPYEAKSIVPHSETTDIEVYIYPASFPNDANVDIFAPARDGVLNGLGELQSGVPTIVPTGSRRVDYSKVAFRDHFSVNDMVTTLVSSTNKVWRGNLGVTNYNGNGIYCGPISFVGKNGFKINPSKISCTVQDLTGGIFTHSSSLATNKMDVSRIGYISGPSGQPYADDHTIVKTGPGTNLFDAFTWIGDRIRSAVDGPAGYVLLNNYIGSGDGGKTTFRFHYKYDGVVVCVRDIVVYPNGMMPEEIDSTNRFGGLFFPTPGGGLLYSMNQPETNSYTIRMGPTYDQWNPCNLSFTNTVVTNAETGFSYHWPKGRVHGTQNEYLDISINTNAPALPPEFD